MEVLVQPLNRSIRVEPGTTLLDALRTLLGLECSGGRSYKTYARHANANSAWLRAVVDNTPRNRQNASRPFATSLLYADHVTLEVIDDCGHMSTMERPELVNRALAAWLGAAG